MRRSLVSVCAAGVLYASGAFAQQPAALPPPPPSADAYPLPPPRDPASLPPPPPDGAARVAPPAESGLSVSSDAAPRARPRRGYWRERLRLLNASLPPLAERSRESRRTEILINSLSGAVAIGLGFVFAPDDGSGPNAAQILLWTEGGLLLAQGITALAIPPARERLSDEFSSLPQDDVRARHARVRFGEEALDRMAADGARRRVIGAIVGVTAAFLPMFILYRNQIFDGSPWPEPPALNALAFSISGIAAVQAIVPLFSRSPEERLRDEYRTRVRVLREGAEDQD